MLMIEFKLSHLNKLVYYLIYISALNGGTADSRIAKMAADLSKNAGNSIVVCNSNDTKVQTLVNAIK